MKSYGMVKTCGHSAELENIGRAIVDSIFRVHNALGPGLLESVYEECLILDLRLRGLKVDSQYAVPITYLSHQLNSKLKLDIFVEKSVVLELKSVEKMIPLYEAQLLTYMKLSKSRLGYLVNFNVPLVKDGIKRIVL